MDHLSLSTSDQYFDEDQEAFRLHIIKTLMDIVAIEMQRLSPAQRDIIELHFLMDKKIADIERILHVGSQSLIDRRNRAIAILRDRLCNNTLVMDLYGKLDDPEDFPLLKKYFSNKIK
jgi:DNA-directed RNA polymerase specialized sigma24 family protein